jgi:hypothetical protein
MGLLLPSLCFSQVWWEVVRIPEEEYHCIELLTIERKGDLVYAMAKTGYLTEKSRQKKAQEFVESMGDHEMANMHCQWFSFVFDLSEPRFKTLKVYFFDAQDDAICWDKVEENEADWVLIMPGSPASFMIQALNERHSFLAYKNGEQQMYDIPTWDIVRLLRTTPGVKYIGNNDTIRRLLPE